MSPKLSRDTYFFDIFQYFTLYIFIKISESIIYTFFNWFTKYKNVEWFQSNILKIIFSFIS